MSRRIVPITLEKGWGFLGIGPPPTLWAFTVSLGTVTVPPGEPRGSRSTGGQSFRHPGSNQLVLPSIAGSFLQWFALPPSLLSQFFSAALGFFFFYWSTVGNVVSFWCRAQRFSYAGEHAPFHSKLLQGVEYGSLRCTVEPYCPFYIQ